MKIQDKQEVAAFTRSRDLGYNPWRRGRQPATHDAWDYSATLGISYPWEVSVSWQQERQPATYDAWDYSATLRINYPWEISVSCVYIVVYTGVSHERVKTPTLFVRGIKRLTLGNDRRVKTTQPVAATYCLGGLRGWHSLKNPKVEGLCLYYILEWRLPSQWQPPIV